jgi:phosphate transport system substrate-binding protein
MNKLAAFLLFFSAVCCFGNPLVRYYNLRVSASSELSDSQGRYPAENLIDQTWQSWAEASRGNGTGEYFTLTCDDGRMYIAGFAMKNGYGNPDYYIKNNRVKSFRIFIDGNYTETIAIKDSISFEQYAFRNPVECKSVRFVIDSVYQGTEFNDTCVSEVALLQETVSGREFYENILLWLGTYGEIDEPFISHRTTSVLDADKLMLRDYLPFDIPDGIGYKLGRSKVTLLNEQSSLRLLNNLPRIDGATAMYPLYSAFVRAVYPEKKLNKNDNLLTLFSWGYFPNNTLLREMDSVIYGGYRSEFQSIVQCNTTSEAYRRLIDGETDIIFCYGPSEAEIKSAAAKGKRFNLTPICKDAFVFIVNEKNNLGNITLQQIRDIYSGRVTNWKSINGIDEPVIAYQRAENSGSQTTLQLIMKGDRLMPPILDSEYVPSIMFGMYKLVASNYYNYNCAIGYSFLFYLTVMTGGSGVKVLSMDGIAPNQQTIQNNSYPFCQTVYAVTTGNESENTKKLIEWILSAQGRQLIEKTGYTPL